MLELFKAELTLIGCQCFLSFISCYCFWCEQAFSHNSGFKDEFTQKNDIFGDYPFNMDHCVIIVIKLQRSVKRNTAVFTNSSLTLFLLLFFFYSFHLC